MQNPTIRIGTRSSPLALAQTEMVRAQLLAVLPELTIEVVPMVTSGDKNTDKSLADIGGKGLFTKELEEGLLGGTLDIAVHSLKDMETHLPPGLIMAAVLMREDPRDALLAPIDKTFANLKQGATVGTSSMRRSAQLKILRPDLKIVPYRGNITTRITKLKEHQVDATLLAIAGLKRIGLEKEATEILSTEHFIPAAGQGTIAIECKEDNTKIREILERINHRLSFIVSQAERSLLATLDGSCRTPIGGYAQIQGDTLKINAMVAKADGSKHVTTMRSGDVKHALQLGQEAAQDLLARGGKECL